MLSFKKLLGTEAFGAMILLISNAAGTASYPSGPVLVRSHKSLEGGKLALEFSDVVLSFTYRPD